MIDVWLLPLLTAVLLTPIVLYVGYFVVVPRVMIEGYRRGMPSTKFSGVDGSEGAGSIDIEYYTLYFDVRKTDVVISGPAPRARHWQIGAFDGMARLIDGGFLNHKTAKLDQDGNFRVRLTMRPNSIHDEDILDCSASSRGIAILRVVLPQEKVKLPDVNA